MRATNPRSSERSLPDGEPAARAARWTFTAVLVAGAAARLAYVAALPASDPAFARPQLDGAAYLAWARDLAHGGGSPPGAYYLAPLYAYLVAGLWATIGERLGALYALQQLVGVATAYALGRVAERVAGPWAAVATAACFLLYQPLEFFAGRPVGETVAIALLAWSLWLAPGTGARPAAAGFLAGGAALARPNLLLVPAAWLALALLRGRGWRRAAGLAAGLAAALLPVGARNLAASGHLVPISSNAGLTAWHGNGPHASGLYTQQPGLSGSPATQRAEATALARARSGLPLDDVEADRWWGREALRERLAHPWHSVGLLAWRAVLTLDNHEHALDYAPTLDRNPWRPTWGLPKAAEWSVVPLALLLGLAAAALAQGGFARSGGAHVWTALAACAVAPIAFYVSSRYRLPLSALLSVPAGIGALSLARPGLPGRTRARAAALGVACAVASLLVPSAALRLTAEAGARSNLASAYLAAGDLAAAEREARRAATIDPRSARARHNLAVILAGSGRKSEAEAEYARALEIDPTLAESAANLAALWLEEGHAERAIPVLRRALAGRPADAACWTNLVVALVAAGDRAAARDAARRALGLGVHLDPELLAETERGPSKEVR